MSQTNDNTPVKLSVVGLLQDLKDGLTRKAIAEKYSLTQTTIAEVFQHPKLKGKKTIVKQEPKYILEDDTNEETDNIEVSSEAVTDMGQNNVSTEESPAFTLDDEQPDTKELFTESDN